MGHAYGELIPAAILMDNPGLTREEFVKKLDRTFHSGRVFSPEAPWSAHSPKYSLKDLGLQNLADVLGLAETPAFRRFQQPTQDNHGLLLHAPWVLEDFSNNPAYKRRPRPLVVTIHHANLLGAKTEITVDNLVKPLRPGQFLERVVPTPTSYQDAFVQRVISQRPFFGQEVEDYSQVKPDWYTADAIVTPIVEIKEGQVFTKAEDLYKAWPQFHPDFRYDFSQAVGYFSFIGNGEKFIWQCRDGRYYLHPETFNRIPHGGIVDHQGFGFTDLIVTAEAVKHKAWKLMSYKGAVHQAAFLEAFPEARVRYERSVFTAEAAQNSKLRGLTHNELIRMRALYAKVKE